MITIDFYSYKGGAGRTFTTVQIARCLAALGKKVVVADFDFDAPGVPVAFEKKINSEDPEKGGLVELIREFCNGNAQNKEEFKTRLSFFLDTVEIEMNGKNNDGRIQILSSGYVNGAYWREILSSEWVKKIATVGAGSSFVSLVKDLLQPALIELGINYLLIDARAGINHYSNVARHVSGVHAMVICPNNEAKDALKKFLLPAVMFHDEQTKKFERLIFILSRIPYELGEDGERVFSDMVEFIKKELPSDIIERTKFLKLHSDLDIHVAPRIRDIDGRYKKQEDEEVKDKKAQRVQILKDFFMILAALCPELISDEALKEKRLEARASALWKEVYGYDFEITCENHLFGVLDTGEMHNTDDGKRNVAFKTVTFIGFLNQFYKTLLEKFSDEDSCREIMNKALFNAGKQCGETFGIALVEQWDDEKREYDDREKLEHWCAFDTQAGFGLMTMSYPHGDTKVLNVKNPFIIDYNIAKDRDYTAFFSGYVMGVLTELIKSSKIDNLEMKRLEQSEDEYRAVLKNNIYAGLENTKNCTGISYRFEGDFDFGR
ncbi:MAG: AAA family ATPase [Candidatus Symbiothrix sp.]|jgi:MinD-like ATPase involved in chromosome partitioning or flagellar assembly|nr:AAA family ATPase [Candidatus Symbiothrix sp.]